ncbi:MAG: SIMPL domain-containing protein [Planctomycetota bacterium]
MSRIRWVSFFLVAFAFSIPVVWGQNQPRSVSVTGRAEKELEPDHYQIGLFVVANGKTMSIASEDYRKKTENLRTVFNEMDFPEVKIVSQGKSIIDTPFSSDIPFFEINDVQIMMAEDGGPNPEDEKFHIVERINLQWQVSPQRKFADLETGINGLLDRVKAEKLSFGPNNPYAQNSNLVVGRHYNLAQEEKSLRAAAFADAKSQAEELAALAGAKVGKVLEIKVGPESSEMYSAGDDPFYRPGDKELNCRLGQKIQLKSKLVVRFELE